MTQQITNSHSLSSIVLSLPAFGGFASSVASLALPTAFLGKRFEPLVLMSADSGRVLSSVIWTNRTQNPKKQRSVLFQQNNPSKTDVRTSAAPEPKTINPKPKTK